MAYIGNQPTTVAFLTDQFSGTGSQTAFTLSAAPANTNSILVSVSGVLQDPTTYSVSGTTLTFSAAPPSGTGNISVRFLGIPASGVTTTAYRTQTDFTATAGQTTFTPPSYTVGYIDVYRNGAKLGAADFTATNGTTVVLASAASSGDLIQTVSFYVSSVLNAIPATAGAVTDAYITSMAGSKLTGTQVIPKATLPTGSVLQVVNSATTTSISTTSATAVSTVLTASITPLYSSSKILIRAFANGVQKNPGNAGTGAVIWLYKNGSNLQRFGEYIAWTNASGSNDVGTAAIEYLDSPATTSSITYTIYLSSTVSGQQVFINAGGDYSTINLMEIAA